ncbi:MAG: hypothetical protein JO269_05230 [Burkholderiaceae bacterium]|nr:hypothetical protein [Burkholderiaceae bacterium]
MNFAPHFSLLTPNLANTCHVRDGLYTPVVETGFAVAAIKSLYAKLLAAMRHQ